MNRDVNVHIHGTALDMALGRKLLTLLSYIVRWLQSLKVNMIP